MVQAYSKIMKLDKRVLGFVLSRLRLRQAMLVIIAHWFQNRGDAEAHVPPLPALEIIDTYRVMRLQ